MTIRSRIIALVAVALFAAASHAQSTYKPSKVKFAAGHSSLRIPIEVENNLILMQVAVNGKPPVRMLFDTGASATIVNADRAEQLGLHGNTDVAGSATGGDIQGKMTTGVTLGTKGVTVFDQPVAIIPMPRPPDFAFDGVIGFDFINKFVVEIDYLAQVMNLHDPATYRYRGKGKVVPLDLARRKTPLMAARFLFDKRSLPTLLELDTGADSAFLLNNEFVEKHKLLTPILSSDAETGLGAGGEQERVPVDATRVSFATFSFREAPVLLSMQKEDPGERKKDDGFVGGEILRRFKLVIDYSRRRVILEPNKRFGDGFEILG